MQSLQTMLLELHWYSHEFKHAFEILNDYSDVSDASIRLRVMPGQDKRRYNLSSTDEVAVILPGDGTSPDRQDIVLHPRCDRNSLARMNDGHLAYSPLHYVLLFPNGDNGWHRDLFHRASPGSTLSPTVTEILPTFSRPNFLLSDCIHTMVNILPFVTAAIFSSNTLLTSGHQQIKHVSLFCAIIKASCKQLSTADWRIG